MMISRLGGGRGWDLVGGERQDGCVTLGISRYLPEPPFLYLHNEDYSRLRCTLFLFNVNDYLPVGLRARRGLTLAWGNRG